MNDQDHPVRVAAEHRFRMREPLLRCGFQIAAERGLNGFVIDDVAERAGVSRGSVCKYFPSTAALVQEVALELSQKLIQTVQRLLCGLEDPAARAAFGVRAVLGWVRRAPAVGAFITWAGRPHAEPGQVVFRLVVPNPDAGIALGRFRVAETLLIALGIALDEARQLARLPFVLPPAVAGGTHLRGRCIA